MEKILKNIGKILIDDKSFDKKKSKKNSKCKCDKSEKSDKCKCKKCVKHELSVKVINSKNTLNGNYYIKKNKFETYVKESDFRNILPIYTKFPQDIQTVNDYFDSYVAIKTMVIDKLGRLYIGGNFNKIGNLVCNNIAMYDGNKWNSLENGLNSEVLSLCIDLSNNLFVGGSFSGTDTVNSTNIIKWNGIKWISLDGGVDRNVSVVSTLSNGKIVIGGDFTSSVTSGTPLQKIATWNGTNWINLGAEFLNDKNIYGMAVNTVTNKIYIGGYNDLPVSELNVNTNVWTTLTDSNSNTLTQIINTVTIDKSTGNPVFGGIIGNFGTVTNVFNAISFDLLTNTWVPLTGQDGYGLDSQCYKLYYDNINRRIIAGGFFTYLTNGTNIGTKLNLIATWNGKNWNPIGKGVNGSYVESFATYPDGTLFIGGDILGSQNIWSKGLVIYTTNYVNICNKDNLLYTLTNFDNSITISNNCENDYIYQKVIK
jgi:hypothetical protein